MTDDDYVEDPWGAPPSMSSAWVHQTASVALAKASKAGGTSHRRLPRRTQGHIRKGAETFVYVAVAGHHTKIGVTTNKASRERDLRASIVFAAPVMWSAALEVEREALSYLGRSFDSPSEWIGATAAEAQAAVVRAMATVSRYKHVDPALSEKDARRARIVLALGAGKG